MERPRENGFFDDLRNVSDRCEALRRSLAPVAASENPPDLLKEAFAELQTSVEELRVAQEELQQQNDELEATYTALGVQQQRYRDLFEWAPDGYLVTDLKGMIREANQAAGALLGMRPASLIGKPLPSYIAEEARSLFRTRLIRAPQIEQTQEWELEMRRRGVGLFPAALTLRVIRDAKRQPLGLRWMVRDRSLHRQAEAQRLALLQEQTARAEAERAQQHLVHILESMPDGFCALDCDGRFRYVNGRAEQMWGRSRADLLGRSVWDIFREAAGGEVQRVLERALHEHVPVALETFSRVQKRWVEIHASPNPEGLSVYFRDIGARKQAQDALQGAYEQQRTIADTLQRSLLRTSPPERHPGLSVATKYQPALDEAKVGGDFYDVFTFDGGKIALVVGDISGKGLAAASCTGEIKYALRVFLRQEIRAAAALSRLNDFVCEARRQHDWSEDIFASLSLAVVDPATGQGECVIAGAEPLLVLRSGDPAEILETHGLLLGIEPAYAYQPQILFLRPGDTLLMATDGITEARHAARFLGFEGLHQIAAGVCDVESLPAMADSILQAALSFAGGRLHDDACLLLARRPPARPF